MWFLMTLTTLFARFFGAKMREISDIVSCTSGGDVEWALRHRGRRDQRDCEFLPSGRDEQPGDAHDWYGAETGTGQEEQAPF